MPINIHGKEYFTVNERLGMLNKQFGQVRYDLTTDIKHINSRVTHKVVQEGGTEAFTYEDEVVVTATLTLYFPHEGDVHTRVYTGHAHEIRGANKINSTSYVECAETSAIGRALASAGWGGTEFCSANELEQAMETQHYTPGNAEQKEFEELLKSHYYDKNRADMVVWWNGGKAEAQIFTYLKTMRDQVEDYDARQEKKALKSQAKATAKPTPKKKGNSAIAGASV